ncbi:MAG: right-handed parallel beta-helix repeat-containing protein [Tyzzerella sp.]|nr:right-handed parallel beta-helix repeat-containing protein [Tyzzerella sp.]
MENNSVTTKQKTKRLVILLAAIFLLCGVSLGGIYAWKTWNEKPVAENPDDDKIPIDNYVPGDLVLDEEGMPEDGSDITETETAIDADTLRALLLTDGKFAIELTEDIRIDETLVVNGTKKLVGNKSIIMELYAEPFQSVASVSAGSTLILDGVTLDGNGIANGVTVGKNAGFTGLSGKILYPVPYGVLVAGNARLSGITIDHSADIGLCVEEGGKVSLEGGKIVDAAQSGIHIQPTAQVTISNDALIEGSQYLVRNRGTCVMTGGTLRDTSGCLVYSNGDFTVDYQGKNADDRLEWYNARGEAGIRIGSGGTAVINGVYVHDITGVGISVVNHGGTEITNTVIANTGSYGFSTYGGKEEVVLKDVQILDTKASAVRAHSTTKTTLTNVTVKNTTGFGIKNENNLVVANNVTIENSENTGIWGNTGSTTEVDGATIIKPGKFGVENNSAKMTLKNVKITDPARMGYVGKRESVTTIANMTIENAPERGIYNLGGTVTASDVTVKSTGTYAVSTAKSGEFPGSMTITNLTVTGVKERDGVNCYESVLTVTKGKISDAKRHGAIASKGGKMTLTDVEISDCGERGVTGSGGDITLKNVTVKNAGKFGVTTSKSGEYVGQVVAENLTIKGVNGNALNNNASVMKITSATISDVAGNGAYAEKGAQLTLKDVEIKDAAKRGIYLRNEGTKAIVTDTELLSTGQSSIFQEPGTVVEATGVTVDDSKSYGVFVKGATFTGQNVTVANTTENSINISASAEDGKSVVNVTGLNIKNAGKRGVANSGGEVTLADVNITNPGTYGATTSKSGEYVGKLDITNLTITGVQKNNALNNNGSVMNVSKGTLSDIAGNGAYVENGGQLALTGVEIKDAEKRGIYVNDAKTQVTLTDTKISGTTESSIFQEPGTIVEADNVTIDTSKSYGVFVNAASFTGKVLKVSNTTESSFNIESSDENGKSVVTVDGLTITNTDNRGVANRGGDVTLTDVTITDAGTYGATTSKVGELVGKLDVTNLTITGVKANNALNCNGSVLNVTNEEIGKISGVAQNGIYVENAGEATLTNVEIDDCGKRGIYVNGADVEATLTNVKVSNTVMTNIRVQGGAELNATDVVVEMNDEIGKAVGQENFYGICIVGAASQVTIDGEKSTVTRNKLAENVVPEKSAVWVESGSLTIKGGTYNGLRATEGGAIYTKGTLNINGGNYAGNSATNGGAIYNMGGNLTIVDGTFESNSAERGAVVYNNGTMRVTGGIFGNENKGNEASVHGGVIFNNTTHSLEITGGTYQYNIATNRGGVVLSQGTVKITGGEFAHNTANGTQGGGVIGATGNATLNIEGGNFHDNTATVGGAIECNCTLTIKDGIFNKNTAVKGGAIYLESSGRLTVKNGATFGGEEEQGNTATESGGAVYCAGSSKATIEGGVFAYNTAAGVTGGGAISGENGTTITVSGGSFHHNAATSTAANADVYGGGAIESNGDVVISGGTFEQNTAKKGGAVYIDTAGSLNITGGIFGGAEGKGNATTYRGGVIYITDRTTAPANTNVTIANATFSYNKVANDSAVSGGVMYVGTNNKVTIGTCTFNDNKAEYTGATSETYILGGVITIDSSEVEITNSNFSNNKANIGGAIYVANTGKLTLKNCEFADNKGTSNRDDDIRCQNTSTLYLGGKVIAQVALNNTAKMYVDEVLTEDSEITVRIINGLSSNRVIVEFTNNVSMSDDLKKEIFILRSDSKGSSLSFADNKVTVLK